MIYQSLYITDNYKSITNKIKKTLQICALYDIINTNRIPNPCGFVIDVFIDIGVKQSR